MSGSYARKVRVMYHKTFEFFQEVESLAERYCLGGSKDTVGESVGVIIRMTINKARVEIVMTAKLLNWPWLKNAKVM